MKDFVENFDNVKKIVCCFFDGDNLDEVKDFLDANGSCLTYKIKSIKKTENDEIRILYDKGRDELNDTCIYKNCYIYFGRGYHNSCYLLSEPKDDFESRYLPAGEMSDGYHTFNELYRYRMLYNAAFFNQLATKPNNPFKVIKSRMHSDGAPCFGGGWFIVMATLPTGQISNHYELSDWDKFNIPIMQQAYKWDGHTPEEAARRLEEFVSSH